MENYIEKADEVRGEAPGPVDSEAEDFLEVASALFAPLEGAESAPVELSEGEEDEHLSEFRTTDEWLLSLILVGVMVAKPDLDVDDASLVAKMFGRRIGQTRSEALWSRAKIKIDRFGLRSTINRIRREMQVSLLLRGKE